MHNSTVGFNALLMNKPLIVLSNSFFKIDIRIDGEHLFFNERIAFTIRNEQGLRDIFTRISEGKLKRKNYEDIQSFLKYYIKYTGFKEININNDLYYTIVMKLNKLILKSLCYAILNKNELVVPLNM